MKAEPMPAQEALDPNALKAAMEAIGVAARRAASLLAVAPAKKKSAALRAAADKIRAATSEILDANAADVAFAIDVGNSSAMVDRSRLDVKRVARSPQSAPHQSDALWLLGDNAAASSDSRHGGPVPLSALRGLVIFRTGPAGRRGFVR
jgi:hypothetical protein